MAKRDNAEQRSLLDDEHQEALLRSLTKRLHDVEAGLHALETWQHHVTGLVDGPMEDRFAVIETTTGSLLATMRETSDVVLSLTRAVAKLHAERPL
jgi:hypothetical protein